MSRVGDGETAYANRGAGYHIAFFSSWTDPSENQSNVRWSRESWKAMRNYSTGASYLNFPGLGEEEERLVRASYGPNYERLAQLKARYDPENLFHVNQNIPPAESRYLGI